MECYGAGYMSGGAYASGVIEFPTQQDIFAYLGGKNSRSSNLPTFGYNGGGGGNITSSYSGGGATDVRLNGGEWNSFSSLMSRIIVAGGSGGTECGKGGPGGGINGNDGKNGFCLGNSINYTGFGSGATQTAGGYYGGSFGYSVSSVSRTNHNGGGGGYYGGGRSIDHGAGGGGGSSFISGHSGCDAISYNSTIDNFTHTGQSIHYSGFSFYHTMLLDGNSYFMDAFGQKEHGHNGDGVFAITRLDSNYSCKISSISNIKTFIYLFFLIIWK